MFWLGAAFTIGNHVGPLDKTLLFILLPYLPVLFCFFEPASGTMKKETISSLKLLVSDGKFLSFPVFHPARGLRDEAAFIGQVSSVYHIHQLAARAAISITAAPS